MFKSLVLRILLFLLIWTVGTFGFAWSRSGADLGTHADSAYRALQMFALDFDVEPDWTPHPSLWVTRYLAAAFTIYGVISVLSGTLRMGIRKCRHSLSRKRAVLLGYGKVNRMLASALLEQGYKITLVDDQFNQADRNFARAKKVLLFETNLLDETGLAPLWLGRAHRIYVACGTDASNLKLGRLVAHRLAASDQGKPWRMWFRVKPENRRIGVHIASPKFMYDLNSSEDVNLNIGREVSFFSIKSTMARVLVLRAQFVQRAADLGCARPHLVLVGAGELSEAIILDALLACVSGKTTPKFTLIDSDIAEVKARFIAHYPHLFDKSLPPNACPEIAFLEGNPRALNFLDPDITAQFDKSEAPATAWIFANRDDEDNLQASLRLQTAMQRLRMRPVPVFKRIWEAEIGSATEAGGFEADYFGHRNDPLISAHILQAQPDWLAKRIHAEYGFDLEASGLAVGSGFNSARFAMHWSSLPVNGRRTNRLAGYHLPQKIFDFGLDWRGRSQGVFPLLPKKGRLHDAVLALDQGPGDTVPVALADAAENEHLRWMLDRAIDGWRLGQQRSNRMRLHKNMVSFDQLDVQTKRLDLTSIKAASKLSEQDIPVNHAQAHPATAPVVVTPQTLKGFVIPGGTTELALHLIPQDSQAQNTLDAVQGAQLKEILTQFSALETACRFHVIQYGKTPFKVTQGAIPRDDPRGLHDWLVQAQKALAPDIQSCFTARPDLNGPA